jgi:hypothetical protein
MFNSKNMVPRASALAVAATIAGILGASVAQAAVTTYQLSNQPNAGSNSGVAPPIWGLRLDGLTTNSADELYVFDFSTLGAMFMDYDDVAMTIHIYGQAIGGVDANTGICDLGCTDLNGNILWDPTEDIWDIDFLYDVGVTQTVNGGFDDLNTPGSTHANSGTLSSSIYGDYIMRDHADSVGVSFYFGDGDDGLNLLGGAGWLDWLHLDEFGNPEVDVNGDCDGQNGKVGWCGSDQNFSTFPTPYTADFFFAANPVPVPSAIWLLGSGLLGLIGVSRRRI